jgi:hypothetical protein
MPMGARRRQPTQIWGGGQRARIRDSSVIVYHPRQKEMPPGAREVVVSLDKAMRDRSGTRRLIMPYCSHGKRFHAVHDASPTQR